MSEPCAICADCVNGRPCGRLTSRDHYLRGASDERAACIAELERIANMHQRPQNTTWWAAALHLRERTER